MYPREQLQRLQSLTSSEPVLGYGNKPAHTVELAAHTVDSLLFWCFVWAGARVPAEALVWTAGPSDPSSLLLNWF